MRGLELLVMKQLIFFFLGWMVCVGNAQEKAHRPEAKDTLPTKQIDTLPTKQIDTLAKQPIDSVKILSKADSLKLMVKKMAAREAVKIDTIRIGITDYQIISHHRDTTYVDTT